VKIGESKISQRGSTVLPKAVREALKVEDGDFVEWHVVSRGVGTINITVVRKRREP